MSITFSTERLITSEGFFPMERPMDSHGRMEQDERGGHLEFMGYVLYGVASGLASAVVLIDLFFNIQIYTSSYILGASAFLAINVGVTILYLRSVMGGAYGWATILAPVVPFVLLWGGFWSCHGWSVVVVPFAMMEEGRRRSGTSLLPPSPT
jgi:hypothetical protein